MRERQTETEPDRTNIRAQKQHYVVTLIIRYLLMCHGPGQSLPSHRRDPSFISGRSMWDLWST